jgi:hypothetical protein
MTHAWHCARPCAEDDVGAALGRIANCPANPLPLGPVAGASVAADEKRTFESFGAPVAGLIRNMGAIQ